MTLEEILLDCVGKVKAQDIVIYDFKGRSPFFEKMILCSVNSDRQATAAISYVRDEALKNGYNIRSVEGQNTTWVLIDCYDIVVSIFTKEEREHFALDKLYMEVPSKRIEE